MKGKMMKKRAQKLKTFVKQEFNSDFYGYEIINPDAETFYITMGINRYALEQHIKDKAEMGLIVIKSLSPFDPRLKTFLEEHAKKIKRLIFVEMNQSGILEDLMGKECEKEGMREAAIANYEKAIKLYEDNPIARGRLEKLCRNTK